ncbi:hypothetical protein AAG570_002661 [Ranatra chinensis]|uniref:Uncharacterized protein n=1 Tax=Ranatra chinensis TaxID=642074 RepID=A0ABD0Y8A3_9HEMI
MLTFVWRMEVCLPARHLPGVAGKASSWEEAGRGRPPGCPEVGDPRGAASPGRGHHPGGGGGSTRTPNRAQTAEDTHRTTGPLGSLGRDVTPGTTPRVAPPPAGPTNYSASPPGPVAMVTLLPLPPPLQHSLIHIHPCPSDGWIEYVGYKARSHLT